VVIENQGATARNLELVVEVVADLEMAMSRSQRE